MSSKTLWSIPFGVSGVLRRYGGDAGQDRRLADALGAVRPEVARDLAAAHGETGDHRVTQIELREQLVEVRGEGVVVVADRRLAGLAEAATVVRDDAEARLEQRRDLLLPRAAAEREAVDQDG